ncbi:hypothetical protein [Candidatus Tisiphia endosymbiont of Empis tessellata]|uniref:hypothetical protein n=1 Tax=Candidatus Tisiphia endosymbiont of Empis tessellata TaxID=3066259 RepID=UPI00313AACAB
MKNINLDVKLQEFKKEAIIINKLEIPTAQFKELFKSSIIGDINICTKGEGWPTDNNSTLLVPVIQIRILDLPFIPKSVEDVKYIAVFIYPEDGISYDDSSTLCIRVYKDEDLELLIKPKEINASPRLAKFSKIIDFPQREDMPQEVEKYLDDLYPNIEQIPYQCEVSDKLFGWPAWCQVSELSECDELIIQLTDYDNKWINGDCPTIYIFCNIKTGKFHGIMQMY